MKERKGKGPWAMIVLVLGILCLPAAGLAFLTAREQVLNQAVMGENTSTVEEKFQEPEPLDPEKSHELQKEIRVKNQENVPCYVRVRILQGDTETACTWKDLDDKLWQKRGEYYYYTQIVNSGESTKPLAGTLVIEKTGEAAGQEFRLLVYEESVQAYNPEAGENWQWLEAWKYYVGTEGGVV